MKFLESSLLLLILSGVSFAQTAKSIPTPPPSKVVSEQTGIPISDKDKIALLSAQASTQAALINLQKTTEFQILMQNEKQLQQVQQEIAKANGCTKGIDNKFNCLK